MGELITKVTGLVKLNNSDSGNPRWEVFTEHGTFRTVPDADCGYLSPEVVTGAKVSISLDARNQIRYMKGIDYRGGPKAA